MNRPPPMAAPRALEPTILLMPPLMVPARVAPRLGFMVCTTLNSPPEMVLERELVPIKLFCPPTMTERPAKLVLRTPLTITETLLRPPKPSIVLKEPEPMKLPLEFPVMELPVPAATAELRAPIKVLLMPAPINELVALVALLVDPAKIPVLKLLLVKLPVPCAQRGEALVSMETASAAVVVL